MKKTLSILSAIILFSSCLSGCNINSESSSKNISSAKDLSGKTIGTQLGTTGYSLATEITDAKVEKYKDGFDAIDALKEKKIDAVIIDELTADEIVGNDENFKILDNAFQEEEYAIAYKKGNDELGQRINAAITTLKNNGTITSISKHWLGTNPDYKSYEPKNITRTGTLVMATNAEFPPYESIVDGEIVGFDVDMAMAICDELGLELEIKNMDFYSVITSITLDEADIGIAGMSVTEEREESVDFTQSYATSNQVIVIRN